MNFPRSPDSRPDLPDPSQLAGIDPKLVGVGWLPAWDEPEDLGSRYRWMARLLENGPQPFAAVDLDGNIVLANRAFADLLGYTQVEVQGMSVFDMTAPQWISTTRRSHAEVLATGRSRRVVKSYRRKDGSEVPVELFIDIVRDDSGRQIGLYAFITDISDRLTAEQALRVSEQQYRELYDEAPVGYTEYDSEGRILSINRTLCDMLGYSAGDMLGRQVFDVVHPDERSDARMILAEKLSGTRPLVPFRRTLLTRDGRSVIAEIHQSVRRDAHGRMCGLRSVVKDISHRVQIESDLVESERRARALFDGIHDAVFVHDLEGRILDANPAACRLLGYDRAELLTMDTRQLDAPEFAEWYQDRLGRQLEHGGLHCEGLHRTKSGRLIPVEISTSTLQFGGQIAVLAILRDITERRALERTRREFAAAQARNALEMESKNQALSESEARYRRLAEGTLDAIIAADADGRITLFNPAAEKVFGLGEGAALGQPLERLIPGLFEASSNLESPPTSPAADPAGPGAGPAPEPSRLTSPVAGQTVELVGRRLDGTEFPLELSLSVVEIDGRPQYIGSIRDQTERQRLRAMLAHTDKLASIGLLSAGVAHEINNPLAYVANNLVVLHRDVRGLLDVVGLLTDSREELRRSCPGLVDRLDTIAEEVDLPYIRENLGPMIDRTRQGVKRVANIVQILRGFARTSPPQWEAVSFSDLVENALEMMRGRLKHQGVEVVVVDPGVARIPCDPSQVSQVLLNLLINALQAIESTGRSQGGRIEVEARQADPWVAISVRDNGCGIEPGDLERLFDPFFTTKPVGEGTGLGLAISHGIIAGHGGRIEVDSRPGEGSCFRILLPLRQGGVSHAGRNPTGSAGPPS